jgi:hypothetical protein
MSLALNISEKILKVKRRKISVRADEQTNKLRGP